MNERSSEDLRCWNHIALTYAGQVDGNDLMTTRFEPFFSRHIGPDPVGLRILDVGCGHGWLAGSLRRRGANAVGVDGSRQLLDVARRNWPDVRFFEADLVDGLPDEIETEAFDVAIASMVVMDVPDLTELGRSLGRCMRSGGTVLVTLLHPAFWNQSPHEDSATGERFRKVTGYLDHEEWWVGSFGGHRHYHRPLSFYTDWLRPHGFVVTDLFEPPVPTLTPDDQQTEYERWFTTIPTMMGIAFRGSRGWHPEVVVNDGKDQIDGQS